jgi:hypothetical protein
VAEKMTFKFAIEIAKDGGILDAWSAPNTSTSLCIYAEMRRGHERNETPFPPPPRNAYWLKFDLGPAMFDLASK